MGLFPLLGWTRKYEWEGYIPFDDLPHMYNQERGHQLEFFHLPFGLRSIPVGGIPVSGERDAPGLLSRMFNRGPYGASGGSMQVNVAM